MQVLVVNCSAEYTGTAPLPHTEILAPPPTEPIAWMNEVAQRLMAELPDSRKWLMQQAWEGDERCWTFIDRFDSHGALIWPVITQSLR